MKKIVYIYILLLFTTFTGVNSQIYIKERVDSLEKLLNNKHIPDTTRINILSDLSADYYTTDHFKGAKYALEGIGLAEKINYPIGLAKCYKSLGISYLSQHDYPKAAEAFFSGLKISEALSDKFLIQKFLANIGLIYRAQGQTGKALVYLHKALTICEELNDTANRIPVLTNIGLIYTDDKQYKPGRDYLFKAYELKLKMLDKSGLERIETNIAANYHLNNDYKNALIYYKKALATFESNGFKNGILLIYQNIAYLYMSIVFDNISADDFTKSIIKNKSLYLKESKFLLEKSLIIAKDIDNSVAKVPIYDSLAKIYKYLGNWEKAYKFADSAANLQRSVLSEESKIKVAEIEARSQNEINENKISLLTKENDYRALQTNFLFISSILFFIIIFVLLLFYTKNRKAYTLLDAQNKQIREAGEELEFLNEDLKNHENQLYDEIQAKEKFISIIAHDIRNPLHGISFSSDFLYSNISRLNSEDLAHGLNSINSSAKNLLGLLTTLLDWARSHKNQLEFITENIKIIDLMDNNSRLFKDSLESKNITITCNIPNDLYLWADRNMLESIIHNLTSNAIKFTQNNGKIFIGVKISEDNKEYIFSIKDTGIGMDKSQLDSLFSLESQIKTFGAKGEVGSGLGLLLCKEFIAKHSGKIWAESKLGEGAEFFFTLPFNNIKTLN